MTPPELTMAGACGARSTCARMRAMSGPSALAVAAIVGGKGPAREVDTAGCVAREKLARQGLGHRACLGDIIGPDILALHRIVDRALQSRDLLGRADSHQRRVIRDAFH